VTLITLRMKPFLLPPTLKPDDLLYVIAPSGTLREREQATFQQGLDLWRSRGYQLKLSAGFDGQAGYLAGTDPDRRQQLLAALNDPDCQGILCVRGGFGGARLLEDWVWPDLKLPLTKWLIGFSDITNLLWSLGQQGISSVHGPVLTTIAAEPDWSLQRLFTWLETHQIEALQGTGWGGGEATGVLLPGNLTVATHLLGTPLLPNLKGVILALEDVSEVPYRLDRALTQWRLSGALQSVSGIALGRFSQCDAPAGIPSYTAAEVLRDRLGDLGIPIISDLPFGHDGVNAALPIGVQVTLNGDSGQLSFHP
jgi:muramoyltetrapeptide carboxypeptidase